jgi:hypothetical protein
VNAVLTAVESALVAHFAHDPLRASVSFVGVDPIEVLRFEPVPGECVFVSLGAARHPMTGAGESVRSMDGPRAELLLRVRDGSGAHSDVWRKLAVLAAAPAVEGVVYAAGMTVDLGAPIAAGSPCTGVVVADAELLTVQTAAGAVRILRVVPATSTELGWCRVHGGAALLDRWARAGVDLLDLDRRPVRLD